MKYKYSKKAGALQEAQMAKDAPLNAPSGSVARARGVRRPMQQQQAVLAQSEIDGLLNAVQMGDEEAEFVEHEQRMAPQAIQRPRERGGRPVTRRDVTRFGGGAGRAVGAGGGEVEAFKTTGTGLDPTTSVGRQTMFFYTVDDGQRVLMVHKDGAMEEIVGPARVWRVGRKFKPMGHYVAHPGEFLIVRFRNGDQTHLAGPADIWLDPRKHVNVEKEEALPIATKEAVVVYSKDATGEVSRRVVKGPATFVPKPGEWLHTFSWHGSQATADGGFIKIPNALVFQKLWLLPDQMYHDVDDVRTADDAVLRIRLMMFFELIDIEKMLESTHDPIGDFVNAASSDVVDFVSHNNFESFKQSTEHLNDLATYKQLTSRAEQCGYRINKVVYRGYGAPQNLQDMHDQAIESRTRLQLEKATEQQAQELEDLKQDRQMSRSVKQREQHAAELDADLQAQRKRQDADLEASLRSRTFSREQREADARTEQALVSERNSGWREHLAALEKMGVDLTEYLTQNRADQVIELRGSGSNPHVHVNGNGQTE